MPRKKSLTLWEIAQAWHDSELAATWAADRWKKATTAFHGALDTAFFPVPNRDLRNIYLLLEAQCQPKKRKHRRRPAVEADNALPVPEVKYEPLI